MAKVGKRYFTAEFKREAVALWETLGKTGASHGHPVCIECLINRP